MRRSLLHFAIGQAALSALVLSLPGKHGLSQVWDGASSEMHQRGERRTPSVFSVPDSRRRKFSQTTWGRAAELRSENLTIRGGIYLKFRSPNLQWVLCPSELGIHSFSATLASQKSPIVGDINNVISLLDRDSINLETAVRKRITSIHEETNQGEMGTVCKS